MRVEAARFGPATAAPPAARPLALGTPMLPPADLEAALVALQHDARKNASSIAEDRSASAKADRDQAIADAKKAEEASKAAESRAGFWSKFGGVAKVVATVAAVVGGAAATVFSAGTAAPAAVALCGLALSMSSPYIGKACGKTAGDVAAWTGIAASLVGGGWSALATTGVKHTALAVGTQATARLVEGGARATEGAATIAEKRAHAESLDHGAESSLARAALKRTENELAEVIELLREVEASARRAIGTVHNIVKEREHDRRALVQPRAFA
ncbi:MAG: hypothetical protein JNL79_01130 [Myxococcales bacterium]|nr:hypothetical protein [Myxococcales bacterium]